MIPPEHTVMRGLPAGCPIAPGRLMRPFLIDSQVLLRSGSSCPVALGTELQALKALCYSKDLASLHRAVPHPHRHPPPLFVPGHRCVWDEELEPLTCSFTIYVTMSKSMCLFTSRVSQIQALALAYLVCVTLTIPTPPACFLPPQSSPPQ